MVVDGEVIEADPPHKLVQTWRMLMMGPTQAPEGFTRLTWEIEEIQSGVTSSPCSRSRGRAPDRGDGRRWDGSRRRRGGWNEILSGLKTLLETGEVLRG